MKGLAAVLCCLCAATALGAQTPEGGAGEVLIKWDLRLYGLDAALGYRGLSLWQGADTILWVSAGGGYQFANYFPDAEDTHSPEDVSYSNLNLDWRLGISQGLLYGPVLKRNLLELVLLYRGKVQRYAEYDAIPTGYPDRRGILQNSLTGGLVWDGVLRDPLYLTREGLYASVSLELVPGFLANNLEGDSQYSRANALLIGYLSLLGSREAGVYLAERLVFDYLYGQEGGIPVSARTTIGGLVDLPIGKNPLEGLGGAVRGILEGRFDGFVKLVNNLELRAYFPSLSLGGRGGRLTPGLLAYFDAGIYDKLTRKLSLDPVFLSTGAGLILHPIGFDLVLYGDYFINENRLGFAVRFGLHY